MVLAQHLAEDRQRLLGQGERLAGLALVVQAGGQVGVAGGGERVRQVNSGKSVDQNVLELDEAKNSSGFVPEEPKINCALVVRLLLYFP
jgi:hypothetical protein